MMKVPRWMIDLGNDEDEREVRHATSHFKELVLWGGGLICQADWIWQCPQLQTSWETGFR